MSRGQFDASAFYSALDSQRQSRRLTWKQVAGEAGVSASTLTRMAQGKRPDVDTLAALLTWSGLKAEDFVRTDGSSEGSPEALAQISAYLRADPNLTEEAASALDAVIKVTYDRLRKTT